MSTMRGHLKGTLTERQRRFVEEYLRCGNAAEATERAGFMRSYSQGVMRQPAVQKLIAERRSEIIDQVKITNDTVRRLLDCFEHRTTLDELRMTNDASAIAAARVLCRILGIKQSLK